MSDTTQGADAPSDSTLFQEAVEKTTTLEKFENPEPPKEPDKPAAPVEPKPADKPADKVEPEAHVPAGRLREESEARRRAERERDELLARFRPQQQPPEKKDLFTDPSAFVREEVAPYLEQIVAQQQRDREAFSADWAIRNFGEPVVTAARQSLEQGMSRGDQNAWAVYQRAMRSHDPYGVITRWHQERETLNSIGGDLDGYRKRVLEEALSDPEYRKRVIEAAKGHAQANGASVARPAQVTSPKAPNVPSLSNIGAGGGDEQQQEPDDMTLFRAATSAKRR
jgi:hypothetical protein